MAGKTNISEDNYVRFTDSPTIRTKLVPSGATVTPLNLGMDDAAMELNLSKKHPGKFNEKFQQMLSHGKGVSVFETLNPERLKLEGLQLPLADENFLRSKDSDGFTVLHHAARCNQADVVKFLVEKGAGIDLVEKNGYTPLHVAVRHKNTEAVQALLEKGADTSVPDKENATPLLFAARKGYEEIACLLLNDPRTNVNNANSAGITPFLGACSSGDRSLCQMLLARGANLMAKSLNLTTALHFAVLSGNVEICELIITAAKKQCSSLKDILDDRDIEDTSALHMSSVKGYSRITELLLRHGADYEAVKGVNSITPLNLSATSGHEETTKLLISSGAGTECRDGQLQTPLHMSAIYNHPKIAEILLEKGAEMEVKNMMDLTPFLLAVIHGAKETAELLLDRGANLLALDFAHNSCLHLAVMHKQVEMVQLLLERGKEKLMELERYDHKTVIHLAACYQETQILDILLKRNFVTGEKDINDRIPLHHAAENGSLESIKSLLRCPSLLKLVNARDEVAMTPLHLAALNKHSEACRLLISKGADIAAQNNHQRTPLHLAVQSGSLETVQCLLDPMLFNTLEITDADQNTPLHLACMQNWLNLLNFLLDKGADVTALNKDNMTCLDMAIEWDSVEVARTLVKHERWREVVCGHTSKIPPMEKLIMKLPEVAEVVLDQCISYSTLPTEHTDFTVTFTFTPLDPPSSLSSSSHHFFAPATMANYRRESLLNHSVTQVLLRWKWAVLGKVLYYFNFAIFFIFLVLFSFFIVDQRSKVRDLSGSDINATTNVTSGDSKGIPAVIFTFLIVRILIEIIQMFLQELEYFTDYTNVLDSCLYVTTMIFILPYVTTEDLFGDVRVHWTAGVLALLLCYVNFCLSLRRLSSVAIYVTMYVEVLVTFLKVIAIFVAVLIGFALVFHVLLKEEENFTTFWFSFVKIIVMMLGEMDYSDVLTSNVVGDVKVPGTNFLYVPLPELSYVMFVLFVLAVSIVLMNLLVGLAVGDIDSIQKTATLRNLMDQASLVDSIQRRYPKWVLRRVYKTSLEIKPNQNQLLHSLALSGSGLVDSDFMNTLRKQQSNSGDNEKETNDFQQRLERQEESIKDLQAAVDAQTELLRAIADKLDIGK